MNTKSIAIGAIVFLVFCISSLITLIETVGDPNNHCPFGQWERTTRKMVFDTVFETKACYAFFFRYGHYEVTNKDEGNTTAFGRYSLSGHEETGMQPSMYGGAYRKVMKGVEYSNPAEYRALIIEEEFYYPDATLASRMYILPDQHDFIHRTVVYNNDGVIQYMYETSIATGYRCRPTVIFINGSAPSNRNFQKENICEKSHPPEPDPESEEWGKWIIEMDNIYGDLPDVWYVQPKK